MQVYLQYGEYRRESRGKNIDKTEGLGDCEIKKQRKNFNILKSNEERREERKQHKWSQVQRKLQLHAEIQLQQKIGVLGIFPVFCSKIFLIFVIQLFKVRQHPQVIRHLTDSLRRSLYSLYFAVQYGEELEMTQHRAQNLFCHLALQVFSQFT